MKLKLVAAAVAASLISVGASAADNTGKFYVLGSVGQAKYDTGSVEDDLKDLAAEAETTPGVSASTDFDDSDTSFSIGGGYQFHKNVAVEVFYRDYGKATASFYATDGVDFVSEDVEVSSTGFGVGLVASYPLADSFSIFGRLDAVNMDTEAKGDLRSSTDSPITFSADDANLKLGFGIGAQYDFGSGFGVRLDVQRIEAELEGEKFDVDSIGMTLLKAF